MLAVGRRLTFPFIVLDFHRIQGGNVTARCECGSSDLLDIRNKLSEPDLICRSSVQQVCSLRVEPTMRVHESIVKLLQGIGVEAAFGGAGENAGQLIGTRIRTDSRPRQPADRRQLSFNSSRSLADHRPLGSIIASRNTCTRLRAISGTQ